MYVYVAPSISLPLPLCFSPLALSPLPHSNLSVPLSLISHSAYPIESLSFR